MKAFARTPSCRAHPVTCGVVTIGIVSPAHAHRTDALERSDKAHRVSQALLAEYGPHLVRRRLHPTDCLIATILSQHTADRNSAVAFEALKRRFSTWDQIASTPVEDLAQTIRSAGLAHQKARHIQRSLHALQERHGSMDLGFLIDTPLDQARCILESLPGVGPKTASCVLLFSCGHQVLPVDTHVHRLAKRLGLVEPWTSAEQTQEQLEELVPEEERYDLHVNLIRHGRQVCLAREPRCGLCVIQRECAYFAGLNRGRP